MRTHLFFFLYIYPRKRTPIYSGECVYSACRLQFNWCPFNLAENRTKIRFVKVFREIDLVQSNHQVFFFFIDGFYDFLFFCFYKEKKKKWRLKNKQT